MKKIITFTFTLILFHFLFLRSAQAVCPVCTVAVAGGLGVSRALGVDDTVTSVWIGGLILSSSFWLTDWLSKRPKYKELANIWAISALMYGIVLIPLYYTQIIGLPQNTLWGIDKILLGTTVGSVAFLKGVYLDKLQRRRLGKQFFNYQKVVFPVSFLALTSFIFYLITK
jgi:hypothetical protein